MDHVYPDRACADDEAADRAAPASATEYADEYAWNDIGIALRLHAPDAYA